MTELVGTLSTDPKSGHRASAAVQSITAIPLLRQ
jgi:hypothetical protein